MKHHIDPKIDCVFKALLGAEDNSNLLVHFLNAILSADLAAPIATVEIINPYNEREYLEDKLSIVDVKARDSQDHVYQVEIQLLNYAHLPARILYNWADIYSQQLQSGDFYDQLKPTYAIWLLSDNLIKNSDNYAHTFKFRDDRGQTLVEHGGIWLLELDKFHTQQIENEQQRWLRFFKDGEQLDDVALPDWMSTEEMRQAMGTLRKFSEKEINYHAYQARQNFLREQQTIQHELETALEEKQAAVDREQAAMDREQVALAEKQAALAEIERLKAMLEQKPH
ncbi:MAG: hypothetical protein RL563_1016 [Pseudomonadota bacterium]